MSHFSCIVFCENPSELDAKLAPFHEFGCTGLDDQYVEDIDITEEALNTYKSHIQTYDSFNNFLNEWYGYDCVEFGEEPCLDDKHKYGYYTIGENENVIKVIDRTNPNHKWDWYAFGGRWHNYFLPLENAKSSIVGKPSWGHKKDGIHDHWVDGLQIKDLDFTQMKSIALDNAEKLYDKYEKILAGRTLPSFDSFKSKYENIEDARREYWDHPVVKDLNNDEDFRWWLLGNNNLNLTREEYYKQTLESIVTPYAFVDLDGNWHEKGEMGWFGISINDKEYTSWSDEFWNYVKSVPDSTYMLIIDCHI